MRTNLLPVFALVVRHSTAKDVILYHREGMRRGRRDVAVSRREGRRKGGIGWRGRRNPK